MHGECGSHIPAQYPFPDGSSAWTWGNIDVRSVHKDSLNVPMYRDEIYSLQILLSRTQAGPGRTVKKEQEEISPNHVQRINLLSVHLLKLTSK